MRLISRALLVLAVIFCSSAYAEEPWPPTNFTFGVPFFPTRSDPCPHYPEGLCLADSVHLCHTDVALISATAVCSAKTQYRFHYDHPGGNSFIATVLEGTPECLRWADIAVLGVYATAVRVFSPEDHQGSVPKDDEVKARELLTDWATNAKKSEERIGDVGANPLSSFPPKILKVGEVTLLKFSLNEVHRRENGPLVLFLNNQPFRLEGWCTDDHHFFSVNEKLHFAYALCCCGCGERISYVYDLSGETPKKVYENWRLSD